MHSALTEKLRTAWTPLAELWQNLTGVISSETEKFTQLSADSLLTLAISIAVLVAYVISRGVSAIIGEYAKNLWFRRQRQENNKLRIELAAATALVQDTSSKIDELTKLHANVISTLAKRDQTILELETALADLKRKVAAPPVGEIADTQIRGKREMAITHANAESQAA